MNKVKNKMMNLVKKIILNKCSEKNLASKELDKRDKLNGILIWIVLLLIVLLVICSLFKSGGTYTEYKEINELELKDFNDADETLDINANVVLGDADESFTFEMPYPKKKPTDEEVVDRILNLINEDLIKNENKCLNEIKSDLYLETKNVYGANITYESVHGYINIKTGEVVRSPKGTGDNDDVLRVIVSHNDIKKVKEFKVKILENEKTNDELRVQNTINALKEMIKDNLILNDGKFIKDVEGVPVSFAQSFKITKTDYLFSIKIILLIAIMIIVLYLYESYKIIIDSDKKRTEKLEKEFSNFIEEYMLLNRAGYTFPAAISYITSKNSNSTLSAELKRISDEISRDIIIYDSLNSFAIRSGSEMIKKFILGLSSNLRRGSSHMNQFLAKELELSNIERKNGYEKRASENSTKAILPLVLILIATMLMVVYPATLVLKM